MIDNGKLLFLCEVFSKYHIRTHTVPLTEPIGNVFDLTAQDVAGGAVDYSLPLHKYTGAILPKALYKFTDDYGLCYSYFLLTEQAEAQLFIAGPYRRAALSQKQLLELAEELGIAPKVQRYLGEYFSSIPIVSEDGPLMVMLNTLCEDAFGSSSFTIVDAKQESPASPSPISSSPSSENGGDVIVNMKALEARYAYENDLIRAVSLGQLHKERLLSAAFSSDVFEKRAQDPVRNAKNYSIIMNTLLRKAAEGGGVHPMYIDRISSDFALRIEKISSTQEIEELATEMFRAYCRLVQRHSINRHSPVVQKALITIDADLAMNLSLSSLSKQLRVSSGYLSSLFKREVGKTLSAYIRERRIKHAIHLLSTTHLQVQTVALHCGIMDVQYFTRLFKKETGKTPREFREMIR